MSLATLLDTFNLWKPGFGSFLMKNQNNQEGRSYDLPLLSPNVKSLSKTNLQDSFALYKIIPKSTFKKETLRLYPLK